MVWTCVEESCWIYQTMNVRDRVAKREERKKKKKREKFPREDLWMSEVEVEDDEGRWSAVATPAGSSWKEKCFTTNVIFIWRKTRWKFDDLETGKGTNRSKARVKRSSTALHLTGCFLKGLWTRWKRRMLLRLCSGTCSWICLRERRLVVVIGKSHPTMMKIVT